MASTPADPSEHDAFYLQYGKALASWAKIEDQMSAMFSILCGLSPVSGMGIALFFSGRSFATRQDLINAAIRNSPHADEDQQTLFRALVKKAKRYSTARNHIAHGIPVSLYSDEGPYEGVRIKEGEGVWDHGGGLGVDELAMAETNFDILFGIMQDAVHGPREGCLERVQELPNDALCLNSPNQPTNRRQSQP